MSGFTIGQLAAEAGVGVETIRFYETRGLLPKPGRPARGYRRYTPDLARRVRFIRRAQTLGFTLREIAELLALSEDPSAECQEVQAQAQAKVADVEARLTDLQRMREALLALIACCSENGPHATCPILESLAGDDSTHP